MTDRTELQRDLQKFNKALARAKREGAKELVADLERVVSKLRALLAEVSA